MTQTTSPSALDALFPLKGTGATIGYPDLATFRATAEPPDLQQIAILTPPMSLVYSRTLGAGVADDGINVIKQTAKSNSDPGRAYSAARFNVVPASKVWRQKADGSAPEGSLIGLNVTDTAFGADPTGATAAHTHINAALAAGVGNLGPAGSRYKLNGGLTIPAGTHAKLKGQGWKCKNIGLPFGDSGWQLGELIATGYVIEQVNTTGGPTVSIGAGTNSDGDELEGHLLIGPGIAATVGVSLDNTSSPVNTRAKRLGLANWDTGLQLGTVEGGKFEVTTYGCNIGVSDATAFSGQVTNNRLDIDAASCGTCVDLTQATKTIITGTIQGCTTGVRIHPTSQIDQISVKDIWFENCTDDVVLDTTAGTINSITFEGNRASTGLFIRKGLNGSVVNLTIQAGNQCPSWAVMLGTNDFQSVICPYGLMDILDYNASGGAVTHYIGTRTTRRAYYGDADTGLNLTGSDVNSWGNSQACATQAIGYSNAKPTKVTDWTGSKAAVKMVSAAGGSALVTYGAGDGGYDFTKLDGVNIPYIFCLQFRFDAIPNSSTSYVAALAQGSREHFQIGVIGDGTHAVLRFGRSDGATLKQIDSPALSAGIEYTMGFVFDGAQLRIVDHTGILASGDGTFAASISAVIFTLNGKLAVAPGDITVRRYMIFPVPAFTDPRPLYMARLASQYCAFWKELG